MHACIYESMFIVCLMYVLYFMYAFSLKKVRQVPVYIKYKLYEKFAELCSTYVRLDHYSSN